MKDDFDRPAQVLKLFSSLKEERARLESLLDRCNDQWGSIDALYRFYHQSFKLFRVQSLTVEIVATLQALAPERHLNPWFRTIVAEGTRKKFTVAVMLRGSSLRAQSWKHSSTRDIYYR